jgi:hypothetical protein
MPLFGAWPPELIASFRSGLKGGQLTVSCREAHSREDRHAFASEARTHIVERVENPNSAGKAIGPADEIG